MRMNRFTVAGAAWLLASAGTVCAQRTGAVQIESWITSRDRSALFQKQSAPVVFRAGSGARGPVIVVDPGQQMQTIDGFGYALTGGSAELLMKMSQKERGGVLRRVFASNGDSIGVSYLRVTIGASDLNSFVFSYD